MLNLDTKKVQVSRNIRFFLKQRLGFVESNDSTAPNFTPTDDVERGPNSEHVDISLSLYLFDERLETTQHSNNSSSSNLTSTTGEDESLASYKDLTDIYNTCSLH